MFAAELFNIIYIVSSNIAVLRWGQNRYFVGTTLDVKPATRITRRNAEAGSQRILFRRFCSNRPHIRFNPAVHV